MNDYLPGQIEPLPIPIYEDDAQQEFHQKIVELTGEIVKNPSNIHLEQQMLDIW